MKRVVLVVLAILLFLSSAIFLFSISAYSILYPDIYVEGLRKAGAFEYIGAGLEQVQGASFIKIPSEGIEAVVTPLLNNFLSYLRGDTDKLVLEVEIDSTKLKNFFLESVNKLPACKPGQSYSFEELDKMCKPEGISSETLLDMLFEYKKMNLFASNYTDLAPIYGIEYGSSGRARLDEIRGYIGYYKIGLMITGLFILVLILGIYFTSTRDLRKAMRFIGIPLILAGLIIFAAVYFGSTSLNEFILNNPSIQSGGTFVSSLADPLIGSAIRPFYIYSLSALILGILLVIISFFFQKIEQAKKI